jgi:hypothetical protein
MSRIMNNRACRAVLVGLLMATQFQLLWMAVFHWREYQVPLTGQLTFLQTNREAVPFGHGKDPCVVCQIVRQNAVRPSVGAPLQQPRSAVYFRQAVPAQDFHSFRPMVPNGRAPPLS